MKTITIDWFEPLDYSCAEALNTLCTNLSFVGTGIKRIMLTSCQAKEGKSFLSMNLMRTMAGLGKRVVLVDADLRRSMLISQHEMRTSGQMIGLSHFLAGMCSLDDVVYQTNITDAYIVPCGHEVANSLPLLNTPRLTRMLDALAKSFDLVLVDAPPVGMIIDAAQIAKSCDGVLLVVSNNRVTRRELSETTRQIEKTGCPILGAVLNMVTFDTHSSKRYYHKTYYSHYNDYYAKQPKRKARAGSPGPAKAKGSASPAKRRAP